MSRYLIKFGLDAPIELENTLVFQYQGHEIRLAPGEAPCEAEVETDCDASDFREALETTADTIIRPFIDTVAFHRKTRIALCGFTRALKAEPGKVTRRVILVDTRKATSQVVLNKIWVKPIQDLLDAARPNLVRPLRWLRNAHGCRSPLERFVYIWLVLENMAGEKQVRKKCQNCGYENNPYFAADRNKAYQIVRGSDPDISSKTFHEEWWDALRNTVFHGKEQLDSKLLDDLTKALDRLQPAVEAYIEHALGITGGSRSNAPSEIAWFGYWSYLEFRTAQPSADFAPDPPIMPALKAAVDANGITSAEQENNCRWLRAADFEGW